MASLKLFLRVDKVIKRNFEYPVILQIIKDRKKKILYTPFTCNKEFWDFKTNLPDKKKHPNYKSFYRSLETIRNRAEDLIFELEREKESSGFDYTIEDFVFLFVGKKNQALTVSEYFTEVINRFESTGKFGNATVYKTTCSALFKFHPGRLLMFRDIDYKFLRNFEEYLISKGNKPNGIYVYMRTLRALINFAIKEDHCKQEIYPFKNKFINPNGYEPSKLSRPTRKRALTEAQIKLIINCEVPVGTHLYDSKNVFLFSFYNRGMNFRDIALLKPNNIQGDRLDYTRAKTGKNFSVKLLQPAKDIIEFYSRNNTNSDYLFPVIKEHNKTPKQINTRIITALKVVNKDIREIAAMAGLDVTDITSYVARHSWGTILKRKGVSTSKISEGYGHSNEKITQIYLDEFEQSDLDRENEKLLEI